MNTRPQSGITPPVIGKLRDSSEIDYVEAVSGKFKIGVDNKTSLLYHPAGEGIQPGPPGIEYDDILVVEKEGVMELGQGISFYELDEEQRLADRLVDIILNKNSPIDLNPEEAIRKLRKSDFSIFQTPKEIAEVLANYAVRDPSDELLDIATGYGTILDSVSDKVEDNLGGRITGIDIEPLACSMSKHHVEGANVIREDFLCWGIDASTYEITKSGYDAVVGNPPELPPHPRTCLPEITKELFDKYSLRSRYLSSLFIIKAVEHLKPGGRGAFVIPKGTLKSGLLEELSGRYNCNIRRVVGLPSIPFDNEDPRISSVIIALEKGKGKTNIGVGKFSQAQIPENATGLFRENLSNIINSRYDKYDAEIAEVQPEDLDSDTVLRTLSNPAVYRLISSDEFQTLGEIDGVDIATGIRTGDNDFFYLEESEIEPIDDRFLTPVFSGRDLPEEPVVRDEDIPKYALDLQEYVDNVEEESTELTDSKILEKLEKEGYEVLTRYIEQEFRRGSQTSEVTLTWNYSGRFSNPDITCPDITNEPIFHSFEVDDSVVDSTIIQMKVDEGKKEALVKVLNTPLYKSVIEDIIQSMRGDGNYSRTRVKDLEVLPISERMLTDDIANKLEDFFPYEHTSDILSSNRILLEGCDTDSQEQILREYLSSQDEFAWSWLDSEEDVEEFERMLESDDDELRDYLLENFDQDVLERTEAIIENSDFFDERRNLLRDLLQEFKEEDNRIFLTGISPQFEGVLSDLVEEIGGQVEQDEGKTTFKMPDEKEGTEKKLDTLIESFFDGTLGKFLQKNIRERRNEIAHGGVVEDDRKESIQFFLAFYALCYASLDEYVRYQT